MSTESNENQNGDTDKTEVAIIKDSKIDELKKTSTAAKLSGAFHQSAGLMKRKIGEFSADSSLIASGREQQLLGKIYRLVGKVRGIREAGQKKLVDSRNESVELCRKHGGRLIDQASNIVDDMKEVLLK